MSNQASSTTTTSTEEDNKEYLDSLLDDALEDFNKPVISHKYDDSSHKPTDNSVSSAWTEEFIASATHNFESTMKSILDQQKDSTDETTSSIDLGAMSMEFAKFAEAAAKVATDASSSDKDFTQCLADTMKQMAKNKEEAQTIPSAEELSKMLDSFALENNPNSDSNELEGLFPLMQTMLENILSKEVLYPPLKQIVLAYPDWLADNRNKLSEEDYIRYNKQFDVMKQVVESFEADTVSDSEQVRAKSSEHILLLMQKLQDLGYPPKDLVGDFQPLMNVSENGDPRLADLSSLLGGMGFPSFGDPTSEETSSSGLGNTTQLSNDCSIM